jgi:hypothetical protein
MYRIEFLILIGEWDMPNPIDDFNHALVDFDLPLSFSSTED